MNLSITKGARQYGYLIWNKKIEKEIEEILSGFDEVNINFNGFNLGRKKIDRKFHRISIGYKFTRALPETHNMYSIKLKDNILEVNTFNGNE